MTEQFKLAIIGAGPIGLACALAAQKAGIDYVILEKGCLVNSLYNYPANMTFFSTSERLEIGGVPFVSVNNKPTRAEALEYYRRVTVAHHLNVRLFETVSKIEQKDDLFSIETSKKHYIVHQIIIAIGFYDLPYTINVPGENLPKVTHYYKDPHHYAFQKVLVVGAQNSAADAALETWRKGAEVTMVIRKQEVGQRVKYWVRPDIVNRIEEGSIKAYYNSSIVSIHPHTVELDTPDGPVTIENDWVIAMTGYQPNLGFLEKIGIQLSDDAQRKPQFNPDTHESNVKGIYLAGVICGGMDTHALFIENSREHAEKIVASMVDKYNVI
jgi:thioredoxin reductase (NADPH)